MWRIHTSARGQFNVSQSLTFISSLEGAIAKVYSQTGWMPWPDLPLRWIRLRTSLDQSLVWHDKSRPTAEIQLISPRRTSRSARLAVRPDRDPLEIDQYIRR